MREGKTRRKKGKGIRWGGAQRKSKRKNETLGAHAQINNKAQRNKLKQHQTKQNETDQNETRRNKTKQN